MKTAKAKNVKALFTIPRILMVIGAAWIIIYSILTATKVISSNTIFGWQVPWHFLLLIAIFYILVPFSVKPGWWPRIWGIFIAALSLVYVIGFFVGETVDYKNAWTYLNPLPHIVMAIGSILWILLD